MNHSRIDIHNSAISCGILQLSRISDEVEDALFAVGTRFYHAAHGNPPAFAIWSNLATVETNGHRFKETIEKLGLGEVHVSPSQVNPNTGAIICLWYWNIDHSAFKNWYKETKISKLSTQYPKKN